MATVNSFEALGKEMNIKKRTPQKEWATPRQEKFLKCPKCGGRMTFHSGTNVLSCENIIEVRSINESEPPKKEKCNFIRLLDPESLSYAEYLFS